MKLGKEIREFWKDEQGVGVIELVLVLVGNYITDMVRVSCVCCR